MSVESLDRQDIAAEVQEELDALTPAEAKNGVTFDEIKKLNQGNNSESFLERKEDSPGTRELKKKVNEILKIPENFRNNAPRVVCFHEIIKEETLDTIKQKDRMKKADLSRELACLSSIGDEHPELKPLIKVCNTGEEITPKNCGLDENDWAGLQELFDTAQDILKGKIHELFLLFGGRTEDMPDITSLATGDGTGTRGIRGKPNIGRIFFKYPDLREAGNDKFKMSHNHLSFIDTSKQAEIFIRGTGVDKSGGNIKIIFKEPKQPTQPGQPEQPEQLEKTHIISWNYSESGLVKDESDIPEIGGAQVSITETKEGPKLIIPADFPKNKRGIEIETESNNYDEINFNIISDNCYITGGPTVVSPFDNGKFNLTPEATDTFEENVARIDWDDLSKTPHKLEITNNSKGYYITPDSDAEKEYKRQEKEGNNIKNDILKTLGEGYGKSEFTRLMKGLERDIETKINNSSRYDGNDKEKPMTENNKKIQKQLALNRFFTSFQILLKNDKFKNNFSTVEKFIDLRFRVQPNHMGISIQ